ncbi:MAG: hypothetical protein M3R59_02515 [Verrucomicrobiota bacterium]|nr:hypothetical protein [Verrucomicrobiota bacterium]
MTAIICALLSALGFYFSIGLGEQWWLAWLAPIPILWYAFGNARWWQVFAAAWVAYAVGSASILRAYAGALPPRVLVLALAGPALIFAIAVTISSRVKQVRGAVWAMFAFATLWAALDFLSAFNRGGGTTSTPAAAEVAVPMLMQTASLVGFVGVTFLLGVVSAGVAATLRTKERAPVIIAVAIFLANAGFGYGRMATPPSGTMRAALVESDAAMGNIRKGDKDAAMSVISAYASQIAKLRDAHVALVVLPENIAQLSPEWRAQAETKLTEAANEANATVVAGFNTEVDGAQRNVSLAFRPGAAMPVVYSKRRLVPVLETKFYSPGYGPEVLPNGIGLEICKDMDFHAMLRADEIATTPVALAVPAWDFVQDAWCHGRIAIMRSIENGVPMARCARNGLLTLNDRFGRLLACTRSKDAFQTVVGELPLHGRGGETIFNKIGDAFGWLCVIASVGFAAFSLTKRDRAASE